MNAEMIEKLKKLAAKTVWIDDEYFDPASFSGLDFEEAYYGGFEAARAQLAREILNSLGVEW